MVNKYTHIEVLLDRSGSMQQCKDATIEGFNSFLMEQKRVEGMGTMTLVQFDDQYEIHQHYTGLNYVVPINRETYMPRGGTALLDAIGRSIDRLGQELAAKPEHLRPSKIIVLIQTDGQENASHEYTSSAVFEKISHQRSKYGWEFVFAGTNQDAIATAASYGIPKTSSIYYSNNAYGTSNAWSVMACNVATSRSYGSTISFTDADRAATVDENVSSGTFSSADINIATNTTTTNPTIIIRGVDTIKQ